MTILDSFLSFLTLAARYSPVGLIFSPEYSGNLANSLSGTGGSAVTTTGMISIVKTNVEIFLINVLSVLDYQFAGRRTTTEDRRPAFEIRIVFLNKSQIRRWNYTLLPTQCGQPRQTFLESELT